MNYIKYSFSLFIILILSLLLFCLTTTLGLIIVVKIASVFLPGTLKVKHLDGQLISHISFDALDYTEKDLHIELTNGRTAWQMTSWQHPQITIVYLHLDKFAVAMKEMINKPVAPSLNFKQINLPFSLRITSLTIDTLRIGSFAADQLKLDAFFNQKHWSIQEFSANYEKVQVSLKAHGQLQKSYPLFASLSIDPLSPTTRAIKGHFTLEGDTLLYHWQGKFTGSIPIHLNGTVEDINGKSQLKSKLSWGENTLSIDGNLPNQLQINASIPNPQILHPSLSGLKTKLVANGTFNNDHGTLNLLVEPGVYHVPQDSALPSIPFQGGHVLIELKPEDLLATGVFTLDRDKVIDLAIHLPDVKLKQITSLAQAIDGKINLHVNSLDFLQGVSKDIDHPHGQLLASITAKGTLSKPDVQGTLTLSNAGVNIPSLGLTLNPIQGVVTSHDNQWEAQGSIHAPSGQAIDLKGKGTFTPQLTGVLNLVGDNFPAMKTAEYLVNISPQLSVTIQPELYEIRGTIVIPTVQLKLMTFSNTVNLTEDAIFVHDEPKTPTVAANINTDVTIKLGKNVAIDVQGLHGFLDGAIQVKQAANEPMTALGELTIRSGTYKAYGQDLSIDHGKLLFSGGVLTNPDIKLRATRKFNNNESNLSGSNSLFDFNSTNLQSIDFDNHLTVGVQVAGHLNTPKITLFSVPARLSQADILSMLLLGKPASQASQSGGQLLLTAISAMNLDSGTKGTQLLSQLKENIGFDFNVQNGSQLNTKTNQTSDSTSVVIGKSLSKRLYLSYNMGLSQEDSNVLTLKYLLNKYFSLQISASNAGNGLDVMYSGAL